MPKERKAVHRLLPGTLLILLSTLVLLNLSNSKTAVSGSHEATPKAVITSVMIEDGAFTVNFDMENYSSDQISVEFTIAKLVDERIGWIGMLQRNRVYEEGATEVIRAGNLREVVNRKNGAFSYTFAHKDSTIDFRQGAYWTHKKPSAEGDYGRYIEHMLGEIEMYGAWDSEAIFRIGITSRQDERFTTTVYVKGSGQMIAADDVPRQDITIASCSSCHDQGTFKAHSNRRHDPQLCTSCHNNFTYDSMNSKAEVNGWVNIDMMTMIHKIHAGIAGYKVSKADYSDTPSIINDCSACHIKDIPVPQRTY